MMVGDTVGEGSVMIGVMVGVELMSLVRVGLDIGYGWSWIEVRTNRLMLG